MNNEVEQAEGVSPQSSSCEEAADTENGLEKLQAIANIKEPTVYVQQLGDLVLRTIAESLSGTEADFDKLFWPHTTPSSVFQFSKSLYFYLLERIARAEHQLEFSTSLNPLLYMKSFHRALMVCCIDMVLAVHGMDCKSLRCILSHFEVDPLSFYNLTQWVMWTHGGLFSKKMYQHLLRNENSLLEALIWESNSTWWSEISNLKRKLFNWTELQNKTRVTLLWSESPTLRHFYVLAFQKIKALCTLCELTDDQYLLKIWTIFEHVIIQHPVLMQNRTLDQIIICVLQVFIKACKINGKNFASILLAYRKQPQATRDTYARVYLETIAMPSPISANARKYGSIIVFFNEQFVPRIKEYATKFARLEANHHLVLSQHPKDDTSLRQKEVSGSEVEICEMNHATETQAESLKVEAHGAGN